MDQAQMMLPPNKAELAAGIIQREADLMTKGQLLPLTGRVPIWVMGVLDAMALRSGKSRNYTMNLVLAAGLEAIQEHLPEEVREELRFISSDMSSDPASTSGEIE
jgi:hypothetical protein